MGNVKYKKVSKNLERYANNDYDKKNRISLGQDDEIGEYYYMSPNDLIPYAKQARRIFDDNEVLELAETIKRLGVTNPLSIIPSKNQTGKFEIISGERRFRAAKLSGITKVPCIILKDEDKIEEISLIENIQRVDLHPIETGDALSSLKQKFTSVVEMAKKIGKSRPLVAELISYSKIPKEIKNYLVEKKIKNRDILRKLTSVEDIKEMRSIVGLSKGDNKNIRAKNILRISLINGIYTIQDKSIKLLSKEEKYELKEKLNNIINRL